MRRPREHFPGILKGVSLKISPLLSSSTYCFVYHQHVLDHSKEDFQHNNPIMTKRKTSSGGKHRKTSEDKTGKLPKKASTVAAHLQGIPEGQILEDEKEKSAETEGRHRHC